ARDGVTLPVTSSMADPTQTPTQTPTAARAGQELKGPEVRDRVIRLAFDGDRVRFEQFLRTLREAIPPDVTVALRGSAVTGFRWEDGAPFDADGPGSSDLDLTMIGGDMVRHFEVFYIPKLH